MSHPSGFARLACAAGLMFASLTAQAQGPVKEILKPSATPAAAPGQCSPLLQHTFGRLQDEKPQSLCQYAGRVVLVVNTASFCGFTPQYKGLEALHARYADKGLVVLGFPSNDFSQEKGSNKEIAEFCENTFGVKFPMFVKSSVRGPDANPLYRQLAAQSGRSPAWNFHKYLIGRDGRLVDNYTSMVAPDNPAFIRDVEKQLAAK
ncbi:MAG: glutathione peroxidase [Myxococcaceae bacterium]|nr:MAG: glutathione peroxidase [Myxococcaceae bacterium]